MDKRDELIAKLEELKDKITKDEWFTIEFAGYWQILDCNHYDGADILDSSNYGEIKAKANAELMVLAPVMMKYILSLKAEVEKENDNYIANEAKLKLELRSFLVYHDLKFGGDYNKLFIIEFIDEYLKQRNK